MIKKAFAAAILLLPLGGCDKPVSETVPTVANLYVYRDAGTGCEYVGASHHGITPRLGRDGKQICSEVRP